MRDMCDTCSLHGTVAELPEPGARSRSCLCVMLKCVLCSLCCVVTFYMCVTFSYKHTAINIDMHINYENI